jgi:hypothetical protein
MLSKFVVSGGFRFSSSMIALCLGLFAFAISGRAQIGNATLGGTVMDPSGAAVANAELTLTNKTTGFEMKVTSNERGEYTFRNVTPATYDLKIVKAGFENYVQKDIVLTINQAGRADATLKVGATTETVTVEGENTLINFDNGTVQGGIDPDTVKDLPLIVAGKPRSSASFAVLLPGVSTGSSNEAFNARINGGIQSGDEALLDGATMQEGFMSQSGMVAIQGDFQMSPDMVQEVKVLASDYDAQYGSSTSGQITMVSKSGGNQYHGAAFEYGRNKALNAAPWNASCSTPGCDRRPLDNEHDFGANVGGPIKFPFLYHGTSKHHSFFYFDWESFHQAGGSNVPTLSIPSVLERSGNFTDWVDSKGNLIPIYMPGNATAACQTAAGVGPGKQFPGNIIPQACISPIAKAYLAVLPQPTNLQPFNNYTLSRPVPDTLVSNSNVFMTRIDHNYGDKDHFYFFWWRQFTGYNTATALPPVISTESPTRPQNSPISRFNWEHAFSTTMTNHATFGYLNRNEGYGSEPANLAAAKAGTLPQIAGVWADPKQANGLPQFTFDTFNQISNSTGVPGGNVTTRPTWVFNDVVNKVRGHHTFTFGGEWRTVQGNIHQHTNESGNYFFGSSTTGIPGATSGSPIAGFLLGAVSGGDIQRRTVSAWYPRQIVWAFHGNDSWKITPKLTFNYGLRWDYYSPSREKYNHFSFFDPTGANGVASGLIGRLAFAGSGSTCGSACFGSQFPEKPWKRGFAPRISAAYSWDQKTVVRAGYGVFFAQAFYPGWGGGMSLDGYNLDQPFATSVDPTTGQADAPFYLDTAVPAPMQAPPFISASFDNGHSILYRPANANRRAYSQQWNLTIERQLPQSVFLSVAYVGNKGTRLTSNLNPINVLNPFDPKIRALEAPLNPNCGTGTPNGCQPELAATFAAGGPTTLCFNGGANCVSEPYAGWVDSSGKVAPGDGCAATVAQALLPFPQFCSSLQGLNENHGNSIYHSFQLKAEKRYSQGLYMLVSYTNSKLITNASDNTQGGGGGVWNGTQGVISPFEQKRNRSLAPDDVPQVLSAAFVYDLPFGKGKRYANQSGFADKAVGGWQVSPIIRYSRGTLMWFRSGTCQIVSQFVGNFGAGRNCLVGLVPGVKPFLQDPNNFDPGKGALLNIAAFEPLSSFQWVNPNSPAGQPGGFGYYGTGPRISNMRGPNYKNVDFALTKNTKISERVNFQFRAELYNAFNLHMFVNDGNFNQSGNFAFNNDVSSPNFGAWTGNVSAPRRLQLGARIEF